MFENHTCSQPRRDDDDDIIIVVIISVVTVVNYSRDVNNDNKRLIRGLQGCAYCTKCQIIMYLSLLFLLLLFVNIIIIFVYVIFCKTMAV